MGTRRRTSKGIGHSIRRRRPVRTFSGAAHSTGSAILRHVAYSEISSRVFPGFVPWEGIPGTVEDATRT